MIPTPTRAGVCPPFNPSLSQAVDFSRPGHWMPSNPSQSPALLDVSNRSVGGGAVASYEHAIVQEDVNQYLASCKSRRNLAARLANKLFTTQEKASSNCRGVCGKTALNCLKVKAIFSTCIKHYPLDRLETGTTAEKEMRNTIEDVCRKIKIVPGTENP